MKTILIRIFVLYCLCSGIVYATIAPDAITAGVLWLISLVIPFVVIPFALFVYGMPLCATSSMIDPRSKGRKKKERQDKK